MKTIKQIREEYDANFLEQVEVLPDEIVLDEAKISPKYTVPSSREMPVMLIFRRITYRTYPNKQTVALYYSKLVDKYLSIPFGPGGNLNLSEAQVVEGKMLDAIKGGAKGALSGALKGAAIGNVAHLPGSAAGAVVGGAIGAYKGAKKALRNEEEIDEDWQSVNRKDKTDGLSQKAVNAYRRENPGSKLQTAVTEKNPSGKRASRRKSFCSRMGGMKKRLTSAKTARDPDSRINKALRRWNCEEDFKIKLYELRVQQDEGVMWDTLSGAAKGAFAGRAGGIPGMAAGALAGGAAGYLKSKLQQKPEDSEKPESAETGRKSGEKIRPVSGPKTYSSFSKKPEGSPITKEKERQRVMSMKENKISDIQKMIREGIDSIDLPINGRQVTLNTSMAKRILEVYDSVNTKNKKIVEGMLNDDLESFKKLLNFSIKA
jgi:hypothetical protein